MVVMIRLEDTSIKARYRVGVPGLSVHTDVTDVYGNPYSIMMVYVGIL